jgi:hypothetical protein
VRFAKLLGTGSGATFSPSDADLTRYAAVVAWAGEPAPELVDRPWPASAVRARLDLTPLASHGRWSGREPFIPGKRPGHGEPGGAAADDRHAGGTRTDGMVVALTRARLRPSRMPTFWRASPPVVAELTAAPGLLARFGFGEAPIGLQGTISVWRAATDLTRFAYRQPEHRAVIARTRDERWYAEDLFARFAVRGIEGDRRVLGWRAER